MKSIKLVTLNVWGGKAKEPLERFLKEHSNVDIFCLQEVYHEAEGKDKIFYHDVNLNFLNDTKKILSDYHCFYNPHLSDWWGLAIFIKKDITVIEQGEHFVHKQKGYNPEIEVFGYTAKNIQFLKIKIDDKPFTVINFHGLWNGKGKTDTEDRINQSKNIVNFIKNIEGNTVICGDFNLLPDTESIKIIESIGLRNLIKEYNINSTRTSLYTKPEKFADYVFVSPGVKIDDFRILPEEVSDHAPIFLEFK